MQKVTLLNQQSELDLNLDLGGQIERLTLKHPNLNKNFSVILPYNVNESFFHSGNFLMYPWVNRIESNQLNILGKKLSIEPLHTDENGKPIHGLYFNKKRRLIEVKKNFARIEPIEFNNNFPQFIETYTLEDSYLTVQTEFFNNSKTIQEFGYGYHPYLRLKTKLEECYFQTNLTHFIPLGEDLLPNKNLFKNELINLFSQNSPIGQSKLDHLLTGNVKEPFFGIKSEKEKIILRVRVSQNSRIPLSYFQIYTPEDRNSIAIEPMSTTGNAFFIQNSGLLKLQPGERIFGEFVIELLPI